MNPSILITPNSKKAGKLDSIIPTDGTGDLDVVRATTATYVGSDGLIKTALANEPRFDYSNGSCPSILVEPQMSNSWTNNNSNNGYATLPDLQLISIIPNAFGNGINGYNFSITSTNVFISTLTALRTFNTIGFPVQRLCLYVKNPSSDFFGINYLNVGQVIFKFSTLEVSDSSLGSIRKINNNTYALYIHNDNSITGQFSQVRISFVKSLTNSENVVGSAIIGLGYQQGLSSGSLPNVYSPIVTTTTSVTRNADVISKSGISDLIGQTQGSLVYYFIKNSSNSIPNISLSNNGTNPRFFPFESGISYVFFLQSATVLVNYLYPLNNFIIGLNKIGITYGAGSFKIYINGSLITSVPYTEQDLSFSKLNIGSSISNSVTGTSNNNIVLISKEILSESKMIQLTTL